MEEDLKMVLGKKDEKRKNSYKPRKRKISKEKEVEQFQFKKPKLKIIPLRWFIRNW